MSNNSNTPPPWSEVPLCYMWRAQDKDGAWFAYTKKPYTSSVDVDWKINDVPENCLLIKWGDPNPDWRDTLQKRPKNE